MTRRDELIAGLRELADFYEQHPDVPLPPYPDFRHCVLASDDDTGTREVEQVATALGADVRYGGHVTAGRHFPGIEFRVYYVRRESAEDYRRRSAVAAAATPEQLAAVDGAA